MVDAILVEQRIEPGETDRAKALFEAVAGADAPELAIEVLQEEGVYTESAFLQRRDDGDYVLYYIEAEDGERVRDVFETLLADPDEDIDGLEAFAREFDAVMADGPVHADVEFLYHVTNPERPGVPAK